MIDSTHGIEAKGQYLIQANGSDEAYIESDVYMDPKEVR